MNKNSKTQQVYEHWESASRELNKDGRKATAPDQLLQKMIEDVIRSEERRVGKECAPMWISRWSPYR